MEEKELAYKRKARLRGKNRKVTIESVASPKNLELADKKARKGKANHKGVKIHDRNRDANLSQLAKDLVNETFVTSPGHECKRLCPCGKVRKLTKLPFFPDHIAHHALMQKILPVLVNIIVYDSYASVKGKGMTFAKKRVRRYIDLFGGIAYFAKLDFVKFYQNIIQEFIYEFLCKTFTDKGVRALLFEVVTACREGLGIGLYPIQTLANYYVSYLVRYVAQYSKAKLFVYCDDIVVMHSDKKEVWKAVNAIRKYAAEVMKQPLHDNIGVQKITKDHALDFVGFQFFSNRTLLRKRMKKRFARKMAKLKDGKRRYEVATSYKGWLMHCDGLNLFKKIMNMKSFKDLKIPEFVARDAQGNRYFDAQKKTISELTGEPLTFIDAEFGVKSKYGKDTVIVLAKDSRDRSVKFFTASPRLIHIFKAVKENNEFPFVGELYNANPNGRTNFNIRDVNNNN